jgi:hypothetical protein
VRASALKGGCLSCGSMNTRGKRLCDECHKKARTQQRPGDRRVQGTATTRQTTAADVTDDEPANNGTEEGEDGEGDGEENEATDTAERSTN